MFRHTLMKILSKKKYYVYHLIYITMIFSIVFLILGFRNAAEGKIESEIIFHKDSLLFTYGTMSNEYPNGVFPSDQNIANLEEELEYLTVVSNIDLSASVSQNMNFVATTADFIETGVPTLDYNRQQLMVQKIDLLYGNLWERSSDEAVAIVDLDTALLVFGTTNVVGKELQTQSGLLVIIGVSSNTITRGQLIERSIKKGDQIDENSYATTVYIPYGYYESLNLDNHFNKSLVMMNKDNPLEINKEIILETLNIHSQDNRMLVTRQDLIDAEMISRTIFFQIIISIIAVFSILGVINLINVSTFTYVSDKKTIGIYKTLGATTSKMIIIASFESLIMGIISSVTSIVLSLIILLLSSLLNHSIAYIDYNLLFLTGLLMMIIVIVIIWVINFMSNILNHYRNLPYYLKGA